MTPRGHPDRPLAGTFASNLAGVGWMAAMQLACTPLFIRVLGVESYGLIGFALTLTALLQVMDLGLAPTINRMLSRFAAGHEDANDARDAARTLEIGSCVTAAIVALLLAISAGAIARVWLRDATLGDAELRRALMLMAVTIAAQLPATYYQSALLGVRRAYEMNVARAVAATLAMGGAALVVTTVSASVTAYFAVHAIVAILHVAVLRWLFWRSMPEGAGARFRPDVLRTAWKFTAAMTAITIGGVVVTQVDRLIVIRLVPLEQFGYYALAWTVAGGLAVITLPAMNTLFPRFSGTFAAGDAAQLRAAYHDGAQLLSVLLLPTAAVVALFANPILNAWTGNATVARHAAPLVTLLAAGMALNGLMHAVYALQLAAGETRLALRLTIVQVVVIVPVVTFLAWRYGALGAACAWPVMNAVYFAAGSMSTLRKLLPGAWAEWIVRDVAVPFLAAAVVAVAAKRFVTLPDSRAGAILAIGAILVAAITAAAFATRSTREAILRRL